MSKAEKSTPSLISNLDDPFFEKKSIKLDLQEAGFSNDDQAWLVEFFKRPDTFGCRDTFDAPSDPSVFREHFEDGLGIALRMIKEKVQIAEDRQTALALLFSLMLDFGPGSNTWLLPRHKFDESSNPSSQPKWIGEFQRQAKFCAQSLDRNKLDEFSKNAVFYIDDLLIFLFPELLNQIVDLELLDSSQRSGWSSNDFEDREQLEYWLKWRFEDNEKRCNKIRLDTLLQPFSDFPEDVLGNKILGLLNAIHYAMGAMPRLSVRLDPLNDGWKVVAHELIPFLELLTEKEPDSSREPSSLLKAWWHLAKVIYGWSMGGLESELSAELRNRLVESAARHIGILRAVLRDTPEVFEGEDSTGTVSDFYQEAFYILINFAPPWKCLKPLLLAFTGLTVQAVTSDLRAWPEVGRDEKLPNPYSNVALWIAMTMYPQNLRDELDRDPHLQGLREEFAKFCLERLKTKGKQKASSGVNAQRC